MPESDDRTTRARIRDAAIEVIARDGLASATTRRIAAAAGVSPALVIHHFGSMQGLRTACDEHVAGTIGELKEGAVAAGPGLDLLAVLRRSDIGSHIGYLARVLGEDSPAVERLVDDLIADAEGYLQRGVETGVLLRSPDPRGRAIVLALWSLGVVVFHRHLQRLLGVDLTDPSVGADPAIARYLAPAYEILGGGILTEAASARLRGAVAALAARDPSDPPPPTGATRPTSKGTA